MMQITHAATAAALGTQTDNIYLAFIGGIVLHFIIDRIPHFWREGDKSLGAKILVVDYSLTIGFIAYLYYFLQIRSLAVYAAIGGALVIDIILVGIFFKTKAGQWHKKMQPHKTEINGWAMLETAIVGIIVLAFAFGRLG